MQFFTSGGTGTLNFWIVGSNDITAMPNGTTPYGIYFSDGSQLTPTQVMADSTTNAYVKGVKFVNGVMFFYGPLSGGAVMGPDALWAYNGNPTAVFARPAPLYTHTALNWMDFEPIYESTVWVASAPALLKLTGGSPEPAYAGSWTAQSYYLPSVQNIIALALSQSGSSLYVATAGLTPTSTSSVYAFDLATEAYRNGGAPLYTTSAYYQIRGIVAAPIQPTPSATPSPTATLTASRTPSASNRAASIPSNTFVLAMIGNGYNMIPNPVNDLLVPVQLQVFYDCGSACPVPYPERVIRLPSTLNEQWRGDAYGEWPTLIKNVTTSFANRYSPRIFS